MKSHVAPALALALALATAPATAFAAEADRLFSEGVKLLDAGKFAEACPKLEQSQKLEPAAGTLLNLAACYEKSGRRAQALKTFREAGDAARARGRADWTKVADDHVRALEGALPKLTIHRGPTPGLEVTLDGKPVSDAELGASLAVDPGTHVVVARASGRAPFSSTVSVKDATSVDIPALEPEKPAGSTTTETGSDDDGTTRRTVGLVTMSVGAAGLLLGGVSVFVAKGSLDDAKARCPSYPNLCPPDAVDPNDAARSWSNIATASFIAGGVLAAGGAVLYFWPFGKSSVAVGTRGSQVLVYGRF
jgi:tetratricopeptide (TPR) repeat protein